MKSHNDALFPFVEPADRDLLTDGTLSIAEALDGHVTFLPNALKRATEQQQAAAMFLQRAAVELHSAQVELAEQVFHAREMKLSWASIGWLLGITGEAARQRFGGQS